MNDAQVRENSRLIRRLKKLGGLRDGLLITGTALYVMGFLVWSIYAWWQNLGLLPAFEIQYFVAGLGLVLVIGLGYGGFKIAEALAQSVRTWLGPDVKGRRRRFRTATRLAMYGMLVVVFIFPDWLEGIVASVAGGSTPATVRLATILLAGFVLEATSESEDPTDYIAPLVVFLLALTYFLFEIYPSIPQELGGVRPRCAYMDVATGDLSNETIDAIIPSWNGSGEGPIVRTAKVDVYFQGRESLLVRPQGADSRLPVYEIRNDVIRAVTWCRGK